MAADIEKVEKKRGGKRPGSGMKKGQKTKKIIAREAAHAAFQQMTLESMRPLWQSQMILARGNIFVYRIDRHGKGSTLRIEHVLLEDPREIADALDIIANSDPNGDEEGNGFYYITTKAAENRAIDSLLDRSLGKATQPISGENGGPIELKVVHFTQDGTNPTA